MKKITKKLFSSLFTSTLLLSPFASFSGEVSSNSTDLGFFVAEDPTVARDGSNNTLGLYKLSSDGSVTKLQSDVFPDNTAVSFSASQFTVDEREGKIYFLENQRSGGLARRYRKYDIENNEFEGYITITGLPEGGEPHLMGVIQKLNKKIFRELQLQLLGKIKMRVATEDSDKVDLNHHRNATAPNLIHSLDASLLHLSAIRFNAPISLIHDSVLCRASDMSTLSSIVREVYMHLFAHHSYLEIWADQIGAETKPPMINTLEPECVIESTYFFC